MMAVGYMSLLKMLVFPHTCRVVSSVHGLKATWERGYKDVIFYSEFQLVSTLVNHWHHFSTIKITVDLLAYFHKPQFFYHQKRNKTKTKQR